VAISYGRKVQYMSFETEEGHTSRTILSFESEKARIHIKRTIACKTDSGRLYKLESSAVKQEDE
jgi:hypothetical protein